MTLHRQELYRTGGGPSTAPDINDVEEKVLAICSNISGLDARKDSDNITDLVQPVVCKPMQTVNIIHIEDGMVEETNDFNVPQGPPLDEALHEGEIRDPQSKWGMWNPKSLKSKVSPALKPNKASVTAKLDQLSAAQLEMVKLQKK